jgi:hypothetical protein
MIKPATILMVLLGLALLGWLDRDGILARSDVAARALGYEVRVEVKLQRTGAAPALACAPVGRAAVADTTAWGRPCE